MKTRLFFPSLSYYIALYARFLRMAHSHSFFLAVPMSFWRFVLIILATNKTTLTDTLCYFFVSWIFRQYLMSHQQWMRLLMIHVFVIFSSREIQIMRKVIYTGSCLVSVCRVVEHTTQHMRMIKISSVKPHFISENRQQ